MKYTCIKCKKKINFIGELPFLPLSVACQNCLETTFDKVMKDKQSDNSEVQP